MAAAPPTTAGPQGTPTSLVDDKGKLIIQGAIKNASAARSAFSEMQEEDVIASRNRARVQSMVDGAAPKSPGMAHLAGNSTETLVNWGDGARIMREEFAPYFDLIFSNETFGTCPIDRDFADESTRSDHAAIIAEELTAMLLEWPDFYSRKIASIMECVTHGVSFDYHEDDDSWLWRTAGLSDFKIHRNTLIGVGNIEECGVRVKLSPRYLYKKIKNPELAKLAGWNVDAVRAVIMKAAPSTPSSTNYEEWEAYWKDNNYLMGGSKRVCPCIFFWHAELDASISQYLFPEDSGDEFLYQRSSRFPDISRFLHVYTNNVGTNTHYHSIRGKAHELYAVIQTLNRKLNTFSDIVDFESTPMFQSDGELEADEDATSQSGAWTIVHHRLKSFDRPDKNFEQSIIPALTVFGQKLAAMTSRVNSGSDYQGRSGETSKYQHQSELEQQARLSEADMELYLIVWQGQWKEFVRRACRKGYLPVEPGGQEVAEFRRRCKQRGVPPEAIDNVDWKRARVSRGLGAGSASARIVQLDRLQPWYSALDPVSQEKFLRMYFKAVGNQELANELTPKPENRVLPDAASWADLSNNQLIAGDTVPVRDGQNHLVIAGIRLEKLSELNAAVSEGGEPALMQLVEPMNNLLMDLEAHLAKANQDDPTVRQMIQLAEQFNEMTTNGLRHKQRLEQNAQREAEHNKGAVGQGGVPMPLDGTESPQSASGRPGPDTSETGRALEMSIRLQEKIDNLQYQRAKNQEALVQSRREFAQKIKHRDLEVAADLMRR